MKCSLAALCALPLILIAPAQAEQLEETGAVVTRNIDYIADVDYADGKDLLDIYMPEGADGVPVIVFFHGGGLETGSKEDVSAGFAASVIGGNIGVVSPNYRLSPGIAHPAHIEDAAAAYSWVIGNIAGYGGDPDRVYLSGHSAGGYLATLLALDPEYLAAHGLGLDAIKGAMPISPFLYVEETAKERSKAIWGEDPADWLAASVTPYISSGKPPVLTIYADGDDDWRRQQNEDFAEAMRAAGNEATAIEVPNRNHGTLLTEITAEDDRIGPMLQAFIGKH